MIDHTAAVFKLNNSNHQSSAGPHLLLLSDNETVLDTKLPLSIQLASGANVQLLYQ